jgi:hypothetical protein
MRDNEEERFRMALNAQISSKEYDMEQLFPLIEKQIISKK